MLYPHLLMASVVGMSIKEIADTLGVNYRTVQQRMTAMGVKTHVFFIPAKDQMALIMEIDACLRDWFSRQMRDKSIGPLLPKESTRLTRLLHDIVDRLRDLDKEPADVHLTPATVKAVEDLIEHGSLSAAAQGDTTRKAAMSSLLRRAGFVSVRVALPDECAEKIKQKATACLREVLDAGH